MIQSESLNRLIAVFRTLPGVGGKTAARYAYKIIEGGTDEAEAFAAAILQAKKDIRFCTVCGTFTDRDVCEICSTRSSKTICVVAQPKDIDPIEKAEAFNGTYHVLHGLIDLNKGVDAEKLHLRELIARVGKGDTEEVILALNADIAGEVTTTYIANALKPLGVKVTRLAYGMSTGSEIEYTDPNTLQHALTDRKPV